jgi:hypothetical protein
MQVTTIKLQKITKSALDEFRVDSESYDSMIRRLISTLKNKNLKKELIESYKSMSAADLELLKEWDFASTEVD